MGFLSKPPFARCTGQNYGHRHRTDVFSRHDARQEISEVTAAKLGADGILRIGIELVVPRSRAYSRHYRKSG